MKRISHYILSLVLLFFIGCQEEIDETITDNEEDRITQGALVTSLIQNVVTMDGSFDNIIDGASCISVELPVEVTVNNVDLTIENENDFQVIEAILEQSAVDEDEFSIAFPITIIHADYTETEITSQEALDQFVIGCGGENAVDDDIENVDFVYPINITLFDANNNLLETVTVSSDEQLFQLLDTLTENVIADFVYPITMSLLDGTFVSMNSLVELQSFLNANSNADFDEDDDNDFDDDDNTEDLGATEFEALLAECPLQINRVFRNGETIRYDRYVFYFATGGNVSIVIEDRQITGSYETASDDNGILITFSLGEELVQLNDTWRVHRIIEDDPATIEEEPVQIDLRIGQDELLYEQDCAELDFNEVLVRNALMTCFWRGVPNGNDGFNEYEFYFNENNELIILNSINGNVLDGTYEVTEVNGGVIVTIDANEPLDDFDGSWNVTDFEENRIEFEDGSNTLVLEQECEDDTMLCFEESLAFEICDEDDNPNDGSTTFNLNDFCENEAYTFYETELDAQTETNQIAGEYTNVVSPQTLYVRYDIPNSSNVEIFTIDVIVENCNPEAQIALVKTGVYQDVNGNSAVDVGDTITYTFTLINGGDVTLENVTITDPLINAGTPIAGPDAGDTNNDGILDLTETWIYTAIYPIVQEDIDAGQVTNQATARGETVGGNAVEDLSDDDNSFEDDPTVTPLPGIAIVKTGEYDDIDGSGTVNSGDFINYTFMVTNQGQAPLTNIIVFDFLIDGGNPIPGPDSGDSNNDGILDTDETWFYSATYAISAQDISEGFVSNQATASGEVENGETISDDSDDDSPLEDDPTVTEFPQSMGSLTGLVFEDANANGIQDPGENGIAGVDVLITDVNGMMQTVTADANGNWTAMVLAGDTDVDVDETTLPGNGNDTVLTTLSSDPETVTVAAEMTTSTTDDGYFVNMPELTLEKTAGAIVDTNMNGIIDAGDTITYSFSVTNTGNVLINGVTIDDVTIGVMGLVATPRDLAPSVTGTATADYVLTPRDIANGSISNQAVATGTPEDPNGSNLPPLSDESDDPTTAASNDPTVTEFPQSMGSLTGLVFEDLNDNGIQDAGESGIPGADVQIEESNGNMQTVITDSDGNWTAVVQSGETTIDVDETTFPNGGENYVLVTEGSDPETLNVLANQTNDTQDDGYSFNAEANLNLQVPPGIIEDTNQNGVVNPGDQVTFNYVVENNGNTQVNGISLTDSTFGFQDVAFNPSDLMPGETGSVTLVYFLTAADIANGSLQNQATAFGNIVDGQGNVIGEVEDNSDDPTDFNNVDNDGDGDFEDPTVTVISQNGIVTGVVFEETDGDGVYDPAIDGLFPAGVEILITDSNNNTQTVTTDSNGEWYAVVPAGDVTIDVDETTLPEGEDNYVLVTAGSDPETINVEAGMTRQSQDDGYSLLAGSLFGHIYEDTNGNGIQDAGEPDLPGVQVNITDSNGDMQSVFTNGNGDWVAIVVEGDTISDIDVTTLGNPNYVQTQGTNPTTDTVMNGQNTFSENDGFTVN